MNVGKFQNTKEERIKGEDLRLLQAVAAILQAQIDRRGNKRKERNKTKLEKAVIPS